jgi:large subunit ribosomal protein L17
MRHGKKFNHLGRKAGHRKALLKNLAGALIENKRITTTLAKAKALRKYVEPIVTKGKSNTTHNRRMVFSLLQSKEAVTELFGPVADKVGDRPGGYTRVIRTGFRQGDGAEMAMIELVDFNTVYGSGSGEQREKRTRRGRRRSGGGQGAAAKASAPVAAVAATSEEE